MRKSMKNHVVLAKVIAITAAAVLGSQWAIAGTSTNSSGSATDQGTGIPAITISFSGQAALRLFSSSQGISTLEPGGSITFNYAPYGGPVVTYYASNDSSGYVQLGRTNFGSADTGVGATSVATAAVTQQHSGLRVEWHEQGSVQGLIDLINDQVGYVTPDGGVTGFLSNLNSRGPSTANPTWINSSSFTVAGTTNGHSLAAGTLSNPANTYSTAVYDLATGRNKSSGSFGGVNGQDRIQFSVGEFKTENFSKAGTPSYSALPGAPGYGLGNPALAPAANTIGLGVAGGRQQFYNENIVNTSTDKADPQSVTSQHYAAGPWNTAGANNIDSKQISVTAVAYTANPGTGLSNINKGDAQWLLTTGRLQNGAEFNVVNRANDAGQRTVPAVNVGIDPSWSVGENDNGDTSLAANANIQKTLGAGIRYSGKTSGTEARNAIAQSRLGFGALSIAESRGAASTAPVRVLGVNFNSLTDTGTTDFVSPSFDNIVNFTYKAVLVSHYNTIKAPRTDLLATYLSNNPGATDTQIQTWWNGLSSAQTGIKGDTHGNVAAFIGNIANSIGSAGAGITPASANSPADALFGAGYLVPGLLNYYREYDGGPLTPTNLNAAQLALQQDVKNNYGPNFTADGSSGSGTQTIGSGAYYGALNASTVLLNGGTVSSALNGGTTSLLFTSKTSSGTLLANGVAGPKGNYLFGNFNQDGRRDYASVKESLNAALSLHAIDGAANSIYTAAGGVSNATVITSLSGSPGWASTANTKGDLIILGDSNADGAFDGKDVYQLARGASLSDNAGTVHLATASGAIFANELRNPNARLNKNAALDFINTSLSTPGNPDQLFIRQTARAVLTASVLPAGASSLSTNTDGSINYTWDLNGVNAFNKFDVNRDGKINRIDAQVVDQFVGKDYHNLADQLSATISAQNGTVVDGVDANGQVAIETPKSISLVDVELNDTGTIDVTDFSLLRTDLGAGLLDGDANFDGLVSVLDLVNLANNWLQSANQWSDGDFDLNGIVNQHDLGLLALHWQGTSGSLAGALELAGIPASAVPEPAGLAMLGAGSMLWLRRRRGGR